VGARPAAGRDRGRRPRRDRARGTLLERKFGTTYEEYKRRVRRWI
jgi:hypothetical protein